MAHVCGRAMFQKVELAALLFFALHGGVVRSLVPCNVSEVLANSDWQCKAEGNITEEYGSVAFEVQAKDYSRIGEQFAVWVHARGQTEDGNEAHVRTTITMDSSHFAFDHDHVDRHGHWHRNSSANFICSIQPPRKYQPIVVMLSTDVPSRVFLGLRFIYREPLTEGTHIIQRDGPQHTVKDVVKRFHVTPDMFQYKQVFMKVQIAQTRLPAELNAAIYVFPGGSACGKSLEYGCYKTTALMDCLNIRNWDSSANDVARLTISEKATLPINLYSKPHLTTGMWFMYIVPEFNSSWSNITISLSSPGLAPARFCFILAAMIVLPTATVSVLVIANAAFMRRMGLQDAEFITCENLFGREFRVFAYEQATVCLHGESYGALLLVAAGCLFTIGMQINYLDFLFSVSTGSRDVCHYNFDCYHPGLGVDLPVNVLVSHVPYFCCGFLSLLLVMRGEHAMKNSDQSNFLPPLNFGVFYGLAACELLEGGGSFIYHICPGKLAFQFDSAMMYAIALLSILALADPHAVGARLSATGLVLMLVVPIWVFSYLGTWFDLEYITGTVPYIIYCVCLVAWATFVAKHASILSGATWKLLWFTRIAAGCMILAVLVKPSLRIQLGGMSKVLLIVVLFVAFIVVARQMYRAIAHNSRRTRHWTYSKFGMMCALCMLSTIALIKFSHTPYKTGGPAWESRNKNHSCSFLGYFDDHDVWHLLSAMALALWTLVLLEMRILTWQNAQPTQNEIRLPIATG